MAVDGSFVFTAVVPELPSDCQPSEGAKRSQSAALSHKCRDELSGSGWRAKVLLQFLKHVLILKKVMAISHLFVTEIVTESIESTEGSLL